MSSVRFPVQACARSDADDTPKPAKPTTNICLFDRSGYWMRFPGGEFFELPGDALDLGNQIAHAINAAYEQGRCDQAREIRDTLDYGKEND